MAGSILGVAFLWIGAHFASTAGAVVIAGPDGAANTTAPVLDDPGFANVGTMSGLSGVYLGSGWVLTANHVGMGTIDLGGELYDPVPGSDVRLTTPVSGLAADLIVFKLQVRPPLPDVTLASAPLSLNDEVVMIGNGMSRGASMTWMGYAGWNLASSRMLRWGTNRVWSLDETEFATRSFMTNFSQLTGPNENDPEAQAVNGDSGGAAFKWNAGSSELVGIMIARLDFSDQPTSTVVYGNGSVLADLYVYRSQILTLLDLPDCDDGLDEDGDGLIDHPDDPGCDDVFDEDERNLALVCDNGLDDDFDGFIDFPEDEGCTDSWDLSEVPEPGFCIALAAGTFGLGWAARRRTSRF